MREDSQAWKPSEAHRKKWGEPQPVLETMTRDRLIFALKLLRFAFDFWDQYTDDPETVESGIEISNDYFSGITLEKLRQALVKVEVQLFDEDGDINREIGFMEGDEGYIFDNWIERLTAELGGHPDDQILLQKFLDGSFFSQDQIRILKAVESGVIPEKDFPLKKKDEKKWGYNE